MNRWSRFARLLRRRTAFELPFEASVDSGSSLRSPVSAYPAGMLSAEP